MKLPHEETSEFYRNLTTHIVGIPKNKTPAEASKNLTDSELVAFYSEKYIDLDVADILLKNQKDRIIGICSLVKEGESYLDVGCANGANMEILQQRGIEGIGLDISIPNILKGREKNSHFKFIHGFAEEIPFKNGYFDIVILGDGIEHFRDPKATLAECLRVSKKGLAICIKIKKESAEEPINPFTEQEILNLLEFYKLKSRFFDREGRELSKENAFQESWNFNFVLLRAEKTSETFDVVKETLNCAGKELETVAKEEILDIDQWTKDTEHSRHETEIARFNLVSHLIEGKKVLEIGCGNGDGSIVMAKKGFEVVGIDLSESGIKQASEIAKKENVQSNTNFFIMDATRLSFPDNSFDSIVIPEVLEHIRSSRKLLEEAVRVVRNGGRIIISIPDGLLVPWEGHLRVFFKETLTTELSQYASEIEFHELTFKKWLICSFFVKKNELNLKEGPLVDVLMPTFNGRKTIRKAIKSVINQTYKNWNLIVVNDGGEDVNDIIQHFNDNRIKYLESSHKGKSHALNVGLQNSDSEFITYLDDDDLLYPLHLEILVKNAIQNKNDFVYADWYEVSLDENMREFDRKFEFRMNVTPSMLIVRNYINHKCIIHKRSLLDKTGIYDESLIALIDWDMIRRLAFVNPPSHINYVTSEHLVYYNKGAVLNRISGQWSKNSAEANQSYERILRKTEELPITPIESKKIIVELLLSNLEESRSNIELWKSIQSRDSFISDLSNQIKQLEEFETSIKRSIIFNVLLLYDRFTFRLFPINTTRRDCYNLLLNKLRHIVMNSKSLLSSKNKS